MENLQGPINSSSLFLGEQQHQQQQLDVEYCLQQGFFSRFQQQQELEEYDDEDEVEEEPHNKSSLEHKVPFLQMLQSIESQPLKEPNFQTLMRIQQLENVNPWEMNNAFIQQLEHESCITHEISEFNSPIKHPTSSHEGVSSESNQEQPSSSKPSCKSLSPVITTRERRKRKRKRTRTTKNKEEIENQRMTHITVERNRRRQMNDHLNSIRSLMPPTYIQRGDQASIIGGAINFVKELEQLLQSLEAQKRTKKPDDFSGISTNTLCSSPSSPNMQNNSNSEMGKAENKSKTADIEVTVIQSHVNMKIECQKKPCQLLKVIVSLEELCLTVLHLNITSSQHTVLYSFNLKIEEECRLKSADAIAAAVHQMFS